MTITSFDNIEELFDAMHKDREAADSNTQSWQAALTIGQCFVKEAQGIIIWGEIIAEEKDPDEDPEDAFETDPCEKFTRCFSVVCPKGELGFTHASTIVRTISRAAFEMCCNRTPITWKEVGLIENHFAGLK